MNKAWQWDVGRTDAEVRKILENPKDAAFLHYAALLLARSNVPREVFRQYLDRRLFCVEWPNIKRRMRKDRWAHDRIQFWQEIYRHIKEDLKGKGIRLRRPSAEKPKEDSLRVRMGHYLRQIRRENKLSQAEVARGAGLTQQFLSKIEQGSENVSLDTLERIQAYFQLDLLSLSRVSEPHGKRRAVSA